jgi:hypothetical protein
MAALGLAASEKAVTIPAKAEALLAQEVRSPFAGTFQVTIDVASRAVSREFFEQVFQKHFTCKLSLFRYSEKAKSPLQRAEWTAAAFQPELTDGKSWKTVTLTKEFLNPKPGANFSYGLGLGVAIVLEKTSPGALELPAGQRHGAELLVRRVDVRFTPKPRNDAVTV